MKIKEEQRAGNRIIAFFVAMFVLLSYVHCTAAEESHVVAGWLKNANNILLFQNIMQEKIQSIHSSEISRNYKIAIWIRAGILPIDSNVSYTAGTGIEMLSKRKL